MDTHIFLEPLREGEQKEVTLNLAPEWLEVTEKDLRFKEPIRASVQAYVAGEELVLSMDFRTEAELLCTICNEWTKVAIEGEATASVPLEEILTPQFDYAPLLREEILLQVPQFIECGEGSCPQRDALKTYLKPPHAQFPFSNL